ncbi:hypothetical protein FRC07_014389, partial [Ceratobasidium sp. 392]
SLAPDHKRRVDAARAQGVGVSQSAESLRRQQLVSALVLSKTTLFTRRGMNQDPEAPIWGNQPPKRPS